MLIRLDQLNKTQKRILSVLKDDSIDTTIWIGSIRGGKGVGSANAMVDLCIRNILKGYTELDYVVGGQTIGSFQRNNEAYLLDISEQAGIPFKWVGGTKQHYDMAGKARLYIFGGDNARSYYPVRGMTLHSAWLDEVTLLDEMFVQTVYDRLSYPDSRFILTSNADTPTHWLKENWIDKNLDHVAVLESDFNENQHYPQSRRERMLGMNPDTAHYARSIQNQWTQAEGLIIPILPEHIVDGKYPLTGHIVMDPGTASITAATLWQRQRDGTYVVVDEYYHEGDKVGRLSDEQHIERIKSKGWTILGVTCDPAGASMKAAWSRAGYWADNAKNTFDTGVQTTNNALHAGKIKIHSQCKNLFREASGYVWRATSETPAPSPDHLMDTLRYGAMKFCPSSRTEALI